MDLESVLQIEKKEQPSPWSEQQFLSSLHSSHRCYVSTRGQNILGYAVISTAADEAELLNLVVESRYQRQGIGKHLLEYLCQALDSKTQMIFLEVRLSNHSAIAFYETLQFHQAGLRPNYYPNHQGQREDAIIMARSLEPTAH